MPLPGLKAARRFRPCPRRATAASPRDLVEGPAPARCRAGWCASACTPCGSPGRLRRASKRNRRAGSPRGPLHIDPKIGPRVTGVAVRASPREPPGSSLRWEQFGCATPPAIGRNGPSRTTSRVSAMLASREFATSRDLLASRCGGRSDALTHSLTHPFSSGFARLRQVDVGLVWSPTGRKPNLRKNCWRVFVMREALDRSNGRPGCSSDRDGPDLHVARRAKLSGFPARRKAGCRPLFPCFRSEQSWNFRRILILLGLFTRPIAFLLAGEMAVAYWMFHAPQNLYPA